MTNVIAGAVSIAAAWSSGVLGQVEVAVRRPSASRLLQGRDSAEVLALVPRLFSLCGRAQGAVAAAALAVAGGREVPAGPAEALMREAVGEHLWRLMIDWPAILSCRDVAPSPGSDSLRSSHGDSLRSPHGDSLRSPHGDSLRSPHGDSLRSQKKAGNATFADFYRRLRSAEPAAELAAALGAWYAATSPAPALAALVEWDARSRAAKPVFLPALDESLAGELFSAAGEVFAAAPGWRGTPAEVGAAGDRAGDPEVAALFAAQRPLAARYLARWKALGEAIFRLGQDRGPAVHCRRISPGVACAWVDTARGPLAHRVGIDGGRVVDYLVIAPTEWNFHPDSVWLGHLSGARAESMEIAENLLRLWVLALDPCVPVNIGVTGEN